MLQKPLKFNNVSYLRAVVVPEDLHTVLPVVEREKLFQYSLMKKVSDSSPNFSENTKLPMLNNR